MDRRHEVDDEVAAAVQRVRQGIMQGKTCVIDLDLRSYFDNVRHHLLLEKIAARVDDGAIMGLLKKILKSSGSRGVPQGGVISPLLSNIYLNEVDRMQQRAQEVTRNGKWTQAEHVRLADDLVVIIVEAKHWTKPTCRRADRNTGRCPGEARSGLYRLWGLWTVEFRLRGFFTPRPTRRLFLW